MRLTSKPDNAMVKLRLKGLRIGYWYFKNKNYTFL